MSSNDINKKDLIELLDKTKKFKGNREVVNPEETSFNAFNLSSDYYYRENFHSDIIAAFLDPNGLHHEGNKYLNLFLDFIGVKNKCDYSTSTVNREKGRLDILIEGRGHCVIIENKINDAVDQEMQIPRYWDKAKEMKLECDKIIYLTKFFIKSPDKSGWSKIQIEKIEPKILCTKAYDWTQSNNLYCGWLTPSIMESGNSTAKEILSQYAKLIKYITLKAYMDNEVIEFYEKVLINNMEAALYIKDKLDNMKSAMQTMFCKIYAERDCEPFDKPNPVGYRNDKFVYFMYKLKDCKKNKSLENIWGKLKNGIYLKIHLGWYDNNKFKLTLWYNDVKYNLETCDKIDIKSDFKSVALIRDNFAYENENGTDLKYSLTKEFEDIEELNAFMAKLFSELKKYYR